ncbi:MAG: GAF domain-containing protein, partial [Candidatus Binatia bacterium]
MPQRAKTTAKRTLRPVARPLHEAEADGRADAYYRELQTLQDISQTVLTSLDIQTTLERILDKTLLVGSFDIGVISLLDGSGSILQPLAHRGYRDPANIHSKTTDPKDTAAAMILVQVIAAKESYQIEDVAKSRGMRSFKKEGVRSALMVPVRAGEEILGVIQLGSRVARSFHPHEIHLFEAIGSQMGLAVQKARLFEEAQRGEKALQAHYRELRFLHEISQTILSSPDLKTILEKILDQTLSITGLDVGNIRLLEPTGGVVLGTYRGYRDEENIDRHHRRTKGAADAGLVVPLVVASRKSRQFEDVWTTEGLRTFKREGVRSAVIVPICTEEEALGVIEAGSRRPRKFRAEEIRLIEAIGNQVGLAAQKARLFEESRKQAADLAQTNRELGRKEEIQKLLKELSQEITTLDLDSLLKKITDKVREFFKVDICDVRIIEKGAYRLIGVSGIEPEQIRGTGRNRGRSKWILENRKPVAIPDITQATDFPPGQTTRQLGIRGYLAVPLFFRGGEVAGVLRALTHQPREFSQAEVDLVQQLANGAAIAIENARLFEETKGSLERIRLLRDIDTAIASTLDLHALLDLLLEKIDSALPYLTATTVRLLNSDTGALEPAACRNLSVDEWKTSAGRTSRGPGNWVLEKRAPVVVRNVQAGPRILEREFFRKYGLVSYVGVPL